MGEYTEASRDMSTTQHAIPVKYLVVYEWGGTNWAAYVPDLPGCVATADTKEEIRERIRGAMAAHLRLMQEDGDPIPQPTETWTELVEVTLEEPSAAT